MSPAVKYTLGRIGLFVACALALWPIQMNVFLKLMIAVLASAGFAYVLLRPWRDQMAEQIASASSRRRAQREQLRAALAGEDEAPAGESPGGESPGGESPAGEPAGGETTAGDGAAEGEPRPDGAGPHGRARPDPAGPEDTTPDGGGDR